MEYTLYQLAWLFLFYSLGGWCVLTLFSLITRRELTNTGFLNLPLCPIYGLEAVTYTVFLKELAGRPVWLFIGGMILSAFFTFLAGFLLERLAHRKWWDFSLSRFSFEGYVRLPSAAVSGLAAVLVLRWGNPLFLRLADAIPSRIGFFLLMGIACLLALDFAGSLTSVWAMGRRILDPSLPSVGALRRRIQKRVLHAYPNLSRAASAFPAGALEEAFAPSDGSPVPAGEKIPAERVFAKGCCFYKLTGLFFLGSFLGDVTETIFCYATTGVIMSRSSVVYGPFSIVWGFGCTIFTALLYKYKDKSDRYIFFAGTVLGGAYEYMCSVLSELLFGTVFWDYSHIPFNLGGRINLLYCFFWGIAAVVWLKSLYPRLSRLIESLPVTAGTWLMNLLIVFMAVNLLISGMALGRYAARHTGNSQAQTRMERILDERFPDERIERIYPNAKLVD